jgi:hypothetical protein
MTTGRINQVACFLSYLLAATQATEQASKSLPLFAPSLMNVHLCLHIYSTIDFLNGGWGGGGGGISSLDSKNHNTALLLDYVY